MKATSLSAEVRKEVGRKVKNLRKKGLLPITVFGKGIKSESLTVPAKEFTKVYAHTGETGLVELKFGKDTLHTLISEVQLHPVTGAILHAQLHAVKLTDKIRANVPIDLIGESPIVVNGTGLLLHTLNELEVEALPTELPEKIEVDISKLTEVGQQINVSDIKTNVDVLTNKEEMVVKIVPAISEEAKKEAEEAAAKAAAEAAATAATTTTSETPAAGVPTTEAKPAE